ncbi:MAG TPA: hypothetical protein VMV14_06650 [Acidimicrobiales bacterium]|nr:hypothetical protein [Acidimicrobiales bacterium]
MAIYDTIGVGYSERRRPDPRIERAIVDALGGAGSVLDVGAGAGSYEPADRTVVADLRTGAWDQRWGHLRRLRHFDAGLRLVLSVEE